MVQWNMTIVRAYYLKESFQLFWFYKQPKRAEDHLEKWMRSAMRSRLEPFKKFVRTLRSHLDGILAWTKQRVSNGAVEGMNNKIKSISHRSFGFRTAKNFIAAIYQCCARLLLPGHLATIIKFNRSSFRTLRAGIHQQGVWKLERLSAEGRE